MIYIFCSEDRSEPQRGRSKLMHDSLVQAVSKHSEGLGCGNIKHYTNSLMHLLPG